MKFVVNALVSATLLANVAPASAATVTVVFDQVLRSAGSELATYTGPAIGGVGLQVRERFRPGRMEGTVIDTSGIDDAVLYGTRGDFYMYCYELSEPIRGGAQVDYAVNFNGSTARTLDFLGAVNAVLNADNPTFDPYAWLQPTSGAMSSAIQLGIWESLYDSDGWRLDNGNFQASSVTAETGEWLQRFFDATGTSEALDARYTLTLEASGWQDMLTGRMPAQVAEVPEPGSLALFGLGLVGFLGTRIRRQRSH